MKNSIHKQNIKDKVLGQISPFQKKILDSYNLPKDVFALKLTDPATTKTFIFDRWSSTEGQESVYDYMKDENLDMSALERKYVEMNELHSVYDVTKEGNGI